jgi:hypothetical protein
MEQAMISPVSEPNRKANILLRGAALAALAPGLSGCYYAPPPAYYGGSPYYGSPYYAPYSAPYAYYPAPYYYGPSIGFGFGYRGGGGGRWR